MKPKTWAFVYWILACASAVAAAQLTFDSKGGLAPTFLLAIISIFYIVKAAIEDSK